MYRFLLPLLCLFFAGCSSDSVNGVLVHSLQASRQTPLFYEDKKILITDNALATRVLNNPVKLGDVLYIGYALADNVTLSKEQISVVSKNAHIEIISTPERINPANYRSQNIDHELQSVGCSPSKENPNTPFESLPVLAQKLLMRNHVIALKIGKFNDDTTPFFIEFKVGNKRYKIRYLLKKMKIEASTGA